MSKIILDTEIISNQHLDLAYGIEALCYHDISISGISTHMNTQDHTKGISLAPQKLKSVNLPSLRGTAKDRKETWVSITYLLLNGVAPWVTNSQSHDVPI